jgi:hypothetical protein
MEKHFIGKFFTWQPVTLLTENINVILIVSFQKQRGKIFSGKDPLKYFLLPHTGYEQ